MGATTRMEMNQHYSGARVLIYSHDSFGLGHLRRCRAIAHSLVGHYPELSVLILSGSPIVGSFDYCSHVDFVRIPGVIKLSDGEYTSLALDIQLEQTLALRESIIYHTAETFAPDLFLVDKEPGGLKGEVVSTLEMLKARGTPCALGLRDVMDDPAALRAEWQRKRVQPILEQLYDEIWVYGPEGMGSPLRGVGMPAAVEDKLRYSGFLRREAPAARSLPAPVDTSQPFVLVTAGGGGDGEEMIDWVLRAYEAEAGLPRAVIVLGPFMAPLRQVAFGERAARLPQVETLTFDSQLELLMREADGVVAMGGYNTFCEILSLDRPALIVPRTAPRREQLIRAQRASRLGLVHMLDPEQSRDPARMAAALRALPRQSPPSAGAHPGLLDGLLRINDMVAPYLDKRHRSARQPA